MKRLRWAVFPWLIALCATGCATRQPPAAHDARATDQTPISEPTPAAGQARAQASDAQTQSNPPPTTAEAASALATQFYDQWFGAFLQHKFINFPTQRVQEDSRKHAVEALGDDWIQTCPDMERVITHDIDELLIPFQVNRFADPTTRPRLIEALTQAFTPGELERLLAEMHHTPPSFELRNALFRNPAIGPRMTEILKLDSLDYDLELRQTIQLINQRMEAVEQRCLHTTDQTPISEPTPAAGQARARTSDVQTHSNPPPTTAEAASALATQFYDQWLGTILLYKFINFPTEPVQEIASNHAAKALGKNWGQSCPDLKKVILRDIDELLVPFQINPLADPTTRPRLIEALTQAFTSGELERLLAEVHHTPPSFELRNALFRNPAIEPRMTEILKLDSLEKNPQLHQTLRLIKQRTEAVEQRCLRTKP